MKFEDLSNYDKETLKHECRDENAKHYQPMCDILTWKQAMNLHRRRSILFGPNQEILLQTGTGLRECKNGLPCSWYCGGYASGDCTEIPSSHCNYPTGLCLSSGDPCTTACEVGKNIVYDDHMPLENKKELCRKAVAVCDVWWLDELDVRKTGFRRHRQIEGNSFSTNIESALEKLKVESWFRIAHILKEGQNHLEISFRTWTTVDYLFWIIIDPKHISTLLDGIPYDYVTKNRMKLDNQ